MGEVLEAVNEVRQSWACPLPHYSRGLSLVAVCVRACVYVQGLHQATVEANGARSSAGPPFKYGIIVCALKLVLPVMSNYYADLCTSMDGQASHTVRAPSVATRG